MSTLDSTAFDAMLKEYYADREVINQMIRQHPFFDRVKKVAVEGDAFVMPFEYGFPGGRSHTASTAFSDTYQHGTKSAKATVTTVQNYQECSISNLTMLQSRSNRGAWARARMRETDNMLKRLTKDIARGLWRTRGGISGTTTTDPGTGTTVTLEHAADAANFTVGAYIQFYTAETGGSARTGGPYAISAINHTSGTLTTSTLNADILSSGSRDFIAIYGDYDLGCAGVADWITSSTSPAAMYGLTRTTAVDQLSGWKFTDTTLPIADAILQAAERVVECGGEMGDVVCWMHNRQFTKLVKEIGIKTQYRDTSDARVGRRSLRIDTSAGDMEVIADPNMETSKCFVLSMADWELIHLDPVPHLWEADGRIALRSTTADQISIRAAAYYNLVCWDPFRQAYVALSTTGI